MKAVELAEKRTRIFMKRDLPLRERQARWLEFIKPLVEKALAVGIRVERTVEVDLRGGGLDKRETFAPILPDGSTSAEAYFTRDEALAWGLVSYESKQRGL